MLYNFYLRKLYEKRIIKKSLGRRLEFLNRGRDHRIVLARLAPTLNDTILIRKGVFCWNNNKSAIGCSQLLLFIGTLNNTQFENFNMCLQIFIHAFRYFRWPGGLGAKDPAFSVDLTRSRAIFRDPEILYIICGTCCTSQGDPDSSFPHGPVRTEFSMGSLSRQYRWSLRPHRRFLRSYRRTLRWLAMPIVAQLTKHRKTFNIVKHHETLVKHCDTSWNVLKHREPLVKHHETFLKQYETSWNTLKMLWNITKHLNPRHWCDAWRCDIGARAEFTAISAQSFQQYWRLQSWYNSADV